MRESERYQFIDVLRGIAVLLVLIIHISELYVGFAQQGKAGGRWIAEIAHQFDFGRMGVTIFFIISGFVIPGSLSGGRFDGSVKFLLSRFFRLFPLFWLSLLFALIAQQWASGKYPSTTDIFLNATMVPDLFSVEPINGAYWTLAVELVFYGMCLALFLLKGVKNPNVLALLALVLTATFIDREYLHKFQMFEGKLGEYPMLLGFMFWGALARARFEKQGLQGFAELAYWIVAIGWLFVFPMAGFNEAYVRTHAEPDMVPRLYGSYFAAFAVFFFSIHFFKIKSAFLSFTGRISYSIYLMHGPVMYAGIYYLDNYGQSLRGKISVYLSLLVVSLATFLLSYCTYLWIEKPSQRLGKRIYNRIENRYMQKLPIGRRIGSKSM